MGGHGGPWPPPVANKQLPPYTKINHYSSSPLVTCLMMTTLRFSVYRGGARTDYLGGTKWVWLVLISVVQGFLRATAKAL